MISLHQIIEIKRIGKSHWPALILLLIFGFWGIAALFHPGLWTAHDIWHNVTRFYWYVNALKAGQILPAWIPQMANGYGYPLFIFSYHLPWLIGAPAALLGVSLLTALKFVYGSSFVVAGLIMYGWGIRLFERRLAALVMAIVYMWAPYHFLTLFVSAAAGVAWAYALTPLVFWGVWEIIARERGSGVILGAIGYAGVLLSHLIYGAMMTSFVLVWVGGLALIYGIGRMKTKFLGISLGLSIGLAAFYLVPFVSYQGLIKAQDPGLGFKTLYRTNFASLKQLLYSAWGYGPIVSNAKDGAISLQVGVAQWLAFGMTVIWGLGYSLTKKKQPAWLTMFLEVNKEEQHVWLLGGLFLVMYGLSVFSVWEASKPIWDIVAHLVALDYPFRLLVLAVLFGSLLAGFVVTRTKGHLSKWLMALMLVTVALYTNRNHTRVNLYTDIPIKDYVTSEQTTNTLDEYLPMTAERSLIDKPRVNAWTQWAFPGQTVLVNGNEHAYQVDNQGLIEVNDIPETDTIEIAYQKPLPFAVGMGLTLMALLLVLGGGLWLPKNLKSLP